MVMFDVPFKSPAPLDITTDDVSDETDTAAYVISRNSGEGADRFNDKGDYLPYDEELAQIEFLTKHYEKVVVKLDTEVKTRITKNLFKLDADLQYCAMNIIKMIIKCS